MPEKIDIKKIEKKKVLAVGAHADDVEFAVGGTLSLLSMKNEVTVLLTTDGGVGTNNGNETSGELVKVRQNEAQVAAKILGVKNLDFFNYPDLEIRNWRKNFFKRFLKYLVKNKPDIVISWDFWGHYEAYIHPDHRVTAEVVVEAVLESTLPLRLKKWGVGGEILNPKPELWLMVPSEASHSVDITEAWEKKISAISVHRSQNVEKMIKLIEERWGKAEEFRIMK